MYKQLSEPVMGRKNDNDWVFYVDKKKEDHKIQYTYAKLERDSRAIKSLKY